jgi:putative hydrolase of the HAD superfamily
MAGLRVERVPTIGAMTHPSDHPLQGLVIDWGGVLTGGLVETMAAWCEADGIDYAHYREVMRTMIGEEYDAEARVNPIHALERGEMTVPHFEIELARRLRTTSGFAVSATGLLERMFARFESAPDMTGLVRRAHASGLRTALLSNSWGIAYPRDGWDDMFDTVVLSAEVGMRKPEPGIFRHVADLLGLAPSQIVFVDDLPSNVEAAVAVGMVGIHHRSYDETATELEALFDLALRGDDATQRTAG